MNILKQLKTKGFAVLSDAIPLAMLDEMEQDIERMQQRGKAAIESNYFSGFSTIRYHNLLNEGEVWQQVATHSPVLRVVREILGPYALLSLMGTVLVNPGAKQQPIHSDDDVYELPRTKAEIVLNTIWALSDFRSENGATRLVAGSHHLSKAPNPDTEYETVPLTMRRGSIGLILGRTYHAGGANNSDARRDAVLVNYCRGAMRTHENLLAGLRPKQLESFEPELRALLGFRATGVGLGFQSP